MYKKENDIFEICKKEHGLSDEEMLVTFLGLLDKGLIKVKNCGEYLEIEPNFEKIKKLSNSKKK